MIYFDTSYLVRLYVAEPGFEAVRRLAQGHSVASSLLGQAEVLGAFHRMLREGRCTLKEYLLFRNNFRRDVSACGFVWLAYSPEVVRKVDDVFAALDAGVFLRTADAIHLASASVNGLSDVHSNDRQQLLAAPHFGLRELNVI